MLMKHLKRFASHTAGNVAIIVALAAVPLLGAAGVAIDSHRQGVAQARLQAALDAGALAGATATTTNKNKIRKIVLQYAQNNGVGDFVNDGGAIKIRFRNDGTIQVSAQGKMKTSLASVLGISEMNVAAMTEVKAQRGGAEVALVVDTTGSMNEDGKIQALRNAATKFVNIINYTNEQVPDRIKVSIVPYSVYVNVGKRYKNAGWMDNVDESGGNVWHGCVGSREYPANISDNGYSDGVPPVFTGGACTEEIEPLTSNKQKLLNKIDRLTGSGYTYIPAGLVWGWRTLSSQQPFSEGADPTQAERDNVKKFIVLMTDGKNTARKLPGNAEHDTNTGSAFADSLTTQLCNKIKSEDIAVFSIAFKVDDANTQNLLKGCATNEHNYYDASDPAQLSAAFQSIASKVASVHLSK